MLLLLGVSRRASEGEFHVRKKEWSGWRPTHMMGTKVTGKTLGLVGMGRIAQAVAHKAHFGFNMKILFLTHILIMMTLLKNLMPCLVKHLKI